MFYKNPDASGAHVVIVYRNFKGSTPSSHVGLGVNALLTARSLRVVGVRCDILPVLGAKDFGAEIAKGLAQYPTATHVVIEAPFVPTAELTELLVQFQEVHFVVRAHSQIGFLQVEAGAIRLMREALSLQMAQLNFSLASNSAKLSSDIQLIYDARCLYLPNLYAMADEDLGARRDWAHEHRELRVGSFGALRLLKNHTTNAYAAMRVARERGCDLRFHVSVNREEGPSSKGILQSLRYMFQGLPWATLVEVEWKPWPEFQSVIGAMDLCVQVSHTETFNIVSADAANRRVPSVVSPAIEFLPAEWQANPDDASDIARAARNVLSNPNSAEMARRALARYCERAIAIWQAWLSGQPWNQE